MEANWGGATWEPARIQEFFVPPPKLSSTFTGSRGLVGQRCCCIMMLIIISRRVQMKQLKVAGESPLVINAQQLHHRDYCWPDWRLDFQRVGDSLKSLSCVALGSAALLLARSIDLLRPLRVGSWNAADNVAGAQLFPFASSKQAGHANEWVRPFARRSKISASAQKWVAASSTSASALTLLSLCEERSQ